MWETFSGKRMEVRTHERRKGSDLSLGNYHMATLSNWADRMHLIIFCLSRFKKFWHLLSLYHTLNLSILLHKILEIRLICSFFRCAWGSVFAFSDDRNVNILKPKEGLVGPKLSIFFLQLYQLVQWKTLPFLTNFALLRGTYICRPLELPQRYSSLINSITQCFNLGAWWLK